MRDVEIINTELIIADLEQIERILPALQKRVKQAAVSKEEIKLVPLLEQVQKVLQQ
jgi:ribosome-binding ATPase YchF (GTP1/OBG family)